MHCPVDIMDNTENNKSGDLSVMVRLRRPTAWYIRPEKHAQLKSFRTKSINQFSSFNPIPSQSPNKRKMKVFATVSTMLVAMVAMVAAAPAPEAVPDPQGVSSGFSHERAVY